LDNRVQFPAWLGNFVIASETMWDVGLTRSPILWVPWVSWLGLKDDNLLLVSRLRMSGSTVRHFNIRLNDVLKPKDMVWFLIKRRDNITFYLLYS
jgi:hypothetical protein